MKTKHWSKVTLLHEVVTNPNITIKGKHSYYSDCWDAGFEESVVRYLQGDEFSRDWEPKWKIDKLHIGDFVCIAAEVVIVMGGIVHIELIGSPCTHLDGLFSEFRSRDCTDAPISCSRLSAAR